MKKKYDPVEVHQKARARRFKALQLQASGKTIPQIAAMWGISRQRVAEILSRARIDAGAPVARNTQATASQRAMYIVTHGKLGKK